VVEHDIVEVVDSWVLPVGGEVLGIVAVGGTVGPLVLL
jgi:hypothetical protein